MCYEMDIATSDTFKCALRPAAQTQCHNPEFVLGYLVTIRVFVAVFPSMTELVINGHMIKLWDK